MEASETFQVISGHSKFKLQFSELLEAHSPEAVCGARAEHLKIRVRQEWSSRVKEVKEKA
eukprot:593645-Hanusia_phi.AAC.5